MNSFIESLRDIVGDRGIRTESADLTAFSTDWRGFFRGRALCVVLPATTAEVATVMQACHKAGVSVVPQGGNTGLAGGATPDASGEQIVLSLARMDAVREIDVLGETMIVEAGCILQKAQAAARDAGMLLPISFAAEGSAQVGGILATNAGGINVVRYGMTRRRVLGLEAVTADGHIVSGLRALRKDNAGYDWKQLFIGSEGTLGVITAAVLQLASIPEFRLTAMVSLESADAALELLGAARRVLGESLEAFELMSESALDNVVRHRGLQLPLPASAWCVLLEAGSSLPGLRDAAEVVLSKALERGTAIDCVIAESERQRQELWSWRESLSEAEAHEGPSLKHDVSVPVSAVPDFLRDADAAAQLAGARPNAFGHAGDGNIHYNLFPAEGADSAALRRVIHDIVAGYGGSISAEHGIGQYRVSELARYRTASELHLARLLKRALDPRDLLNPGKVLPALP